MNWDANALERFMKERQTAILEEAARNHLLHELPRRPSRLAGLRFALGRLLVAAGQRLQGTRPTYGGHL